MHWCSVSRLLNKNGDGHHTIDTTEDHSPVQRPSYLGDLPAELKIRPAAVVDPNTTTIETPTVALPAWRVAALLQ